MKDYKSILRQDNESLLMWLVDNFTMDMPTEIITVEDMEWAARALMQLSANFSYLCALGSYAKIATREAKRTLTKEEYEDMVDKKEMIQNITDCVKQEYSAISRAVTIHIENNAELKMSSGNYIKRQ